MDALKARRDVAEPRAGHAWRAKDGRRGVECRRVPHQRDGRTVLARLARLMRTASQNQSDKSKVFHNPAASSGFLPLARGL